MLTLLIILIFLEIKFYEFGKSVDLALTVTVDSDVKVADLLELVKEYFRTEDFYILHMGGTPVEKASQRPDSIVANIDEKVLVPLPSYGWSPKLINIESLVLVSEWGGIRKGS